MLYVPACSWVGNGPSWDLARASKKNGRFLGIGQSPVLDSAVFTPLAGWLADWLARLCPVPSANHTVAFSELERKAAVLSSAQY